VELEKDEHGTSDYVKRLYAISQRYKIEHQHREKDWTFHDEPAQIATHGKTPSIVESHAVSGRDELQADENQASQNGHHWQKIMIKLGKTLHS
jgi:hypothetical protein